MTCTYKSYANERYTATRRNATKLKLDKKTKNDYRQTWKKYYIVYIYIINNL